MSVFLYFLLVAIVCFFYALNLFLRGKWKKYIEMFLAMATILLVIISFFLFGWVWGLAVLVSPFVFVGLSRPAAEALAYRILGYRTGVDDPIGEEALSWPPSKSEVRELERNRKRLSSIAKKSSISSLLNEHGMTFEEYDELFRTVWYSHVHDMAAYSNEVGQGL